LRLVLESHYKASKVKKVACRVALSPKNLYYFCEEKFYSSLAFAQLAAILNEKEKLIETDEVKAGSVVNVPLKQKQAELGSYFSKVVDSAGQKEAKHKEKVLKKRKRRAQPESESEEIVEKEAKKLKKNTKESTKQY